MFLIVGLGNPGTKYARTRHNAGFVVIDNLQIGKLANFSSWKSSSKLHGEISEGMLENFPAIILKPHTFMNLSGASVSAAMKKYKVKADHLIVIHDDMDFPLGTVKVQRNRSSAGHNGVQSIIDARGTKDFIRVRVGVGPRPAQVPGDKFVLQRFTASEFFTFKTKIIPEAIAHIRNMIKVK